MIKMMRTFFFLAFLAIAVQTQAQKDWVWEQYSIAFTLADDFKPVSNSGEEFIAKGDGMDFSIFPFKDESINDDDIANYTVAVAKSMNLQEIDDADVLKLNGLNGAYVEGYKDGDRVILMGFIDPETDTNFFCVIEFGDTDKEAENEAVRMISSIRKK